MQEAPKKGRFSAQSGIVGASVPWYRTDLLHKQGSGLDGKDSEQCAVDSDA